MPAMPTTPIGEVQNYPREKLKAMAFQAVRKVRVAWDDRYNWVNFFLYGGQSTGNYPYFLDEGIPTNSAIKEIAVEPDGFCKIWNDGTPGHESKAEYTHAILTLVYESAGFSAGAVVIESVEPRHEMQHVSAKNLYFGVGMPLASPPAIHVPGFTYRLTYPRAQAVPGIVGYPGLVNWDVYQMKMLPLYIYPFCGLYAGSEITGTYDYAGTATLGIQHTVFVRGAPWNYEYNAYNGSWGPVYSPLGVITKYAQVGFSGLF